MEIQATTYPDADLSAARNAASPKTGLAQIVKTDSDKTSDETSVENPAETSQDSAIVEISDEAKKIGAMEEAASGQTTAAATTNQSARKESLRDAQAFVYGALGMEHPDDTSHPKDGFYSAGKWLAAAATVGTIVSLLA